jgi:hypothetical protein
MIMEGLLRRSIPILTRRLLTAVRALVLLGAELAHQAADLFTADLILRDSIGAGAAIRDRRRSRPDALTPTRRATIVVAWLVIGVAWRVIEMIAALNAIFIGLTAASM